MFPPLFVVSHLYSDSSKLVTSLEEKTKFIDIVNPISHPQDLIELTQGYNCPCGFHLLYNHEFSCRELYKNSKFIFLIRDPRQTMSALIENGFTASQAYNYYIFRIRRIYEMFKETNGTFYLWNDLYKDRIDLSNKLPRNLLDKSENIYEKYLFHIKSILQKRGVS